MRAIKCVAVLCIMIGMLFAFSAAPSAEAAPGGGFPGNFPRYVDTGTVIEIGPGLNGQMCTVFLADRDGGLYTFNGVTNYTPGTRLKVVGNTCPICSQIIQCGTPTSPLLNVVATVI